MPGLYRANPSVTAKNGKTGRAGLALPFTPTVGSLRFRQDHSDFFESPMVEDFYSGKIPWEGETSELAGGGIKSYGMDNCVVVCAAELKGRLGEKSSWGRGFFAHLPGGNWGMCDLETKFSRFSKSVERNSCYTLVMSNFDTGTREAVRPVYENGFPPDKLSVYVSNIGTIGVAVEFKRMGEFGEITWTDLRSHHGPYGVISAGVTSYYM